MTPTATRRCILGCEGLSLSTQEAAFFRDAAPWGFILFARNVESPEQLRALTTDLRNAVGWDAPILIDQEGGRVERMTAPHFRTWAPPLDDMAATAPRFRARRMFLRALLIGDDLARVGIDVNCTPLGDIATDETHPFLRNRTYGDSATEVIDLARANAEGCLAAGVLPVLKHIPGHGRGTRDSHLEMPRVSADLVELEATDFTVFKALNDLPLGMSAHLLYDALDPDLPGTISPKVQAYVREAIGFDGLMMTDDLSMEALPGGIGDRARASIGAGIDLILHCNGKRPEMEAVLSEAPEMTAPQRQKADAALALRTRDSIDIAAVEAEFEALARGR